MKILQVTSTARRRGAEVFASQLGDALGVGHDVTTVSLEPLTREAELPFTHLAHGRSDPRGLAQLVRHVRSNDIVIAHGGSTLLPVAIAAAAGRRPFVYRNIGDPSYWGRVRAARLRIGLPLRAATHVMALYQGSASYMVDRYGLDPTRVTVSPNAVDVDAFPQRDREVRRAARAELGLDPHQTVLGYLGNLSAEKRPDWALDAVTEIDDSVLIIAGDGPLEPALEARAQRLGTRSGSPACRLLGPTADPARFLSAIDVLLLPSVTEGIPGVLLEASLVGVPTVATDVGGVPEVMALTGGGLCIGVDDRDGFVEAVRTASSDPGALLADRAAAVSHFGLDSVVDTWEETLTRVLNS